MTAPVIGTNFCARACASAYGSNTNPACDDFDELYARIKELINAYIDSPEGADEPTAMLMCRLAACISDVIPMEERKRRWSRAN